jgi:uncharacterized protein
MRASVAGLWRYPVKSMMGEELEAANVTDRGLLGDRVYALVDAIDGKIASAKNPRKWRKLFAHRAALIEPAHPGEPPPPVRITLPDGSDLVSNQEDTDQILSGTVGRPVVLRARASRNATFEEFWPDLDGLDHRDAVTDERAAEAAPLGTFFDYAVLHVLTTATLDYLAELYPQGRFEPRRFRPNILIQTDEASHGFVENGWVGRTLRIGDEVRIKLTDPCPRCVMTTLAQGDLPEDPGILRTLARHNRVVGGEYLGPAGVYAASAGAWATTLIGGRVRRGDQVLVD